MRFALIILLLVPLGVQAQEKEVLPPPRAEPVPQQNLLMTNQYFGRPDIPEPGRRNVWELFAVDSRGMFVRRVVQAPMGPYYLDTGRPYPWTTTDSLPYMPYTTD